MLHAPSSPSRRSLQGEVWSLTLPQQEGSGGLDLLLLLSNASRAEGWATDKRGEDPDKRHHALKTRAHQGISDHNYPRQNQNKDSKGEKMFYM